MIYNTTSAVQKRQILRDKLNSGRILQFPGAFNALCAMAIEKQCFDGVYVSGAVMSNSLGYPDVGLTHLGDVVHQTEKIARITSLPTIIDIDTGFGETLNLVRTIEELENLGLAGCHLEDQINPKRCGHLDNKVLISKQEMIKKVVTASKTKNDQNFLIIARCDARSVEGLTCAIDRMKAYIDAGADMIFPEALVDESEFEIVRKELSVPLLANMTEFGKSKLLNINQLNNIGFNIVIYPVTLQRLAMKAIVDGLSTIKQFGTQESLLNSMQTRSELYDLLEYEKYNQFDSSIFNFNLNSYQ